MHNDVDTRGHIPHEPLVKNVSDKKLNPVWLHFRHCIWSVFFEWMNSCQVDTSSDGQIIHDTDGRIVAKEQLTDEIAPYKPASPSNQPLRHL